jgi:heme-degrading monooxygenase HmoA
MTCACMTICTYRARAGEEDAIVALHEDWQRTLRARARGYLSGELLHSAGNPLLFVAITRFESEAAARALARDPDHAAWRRRLASLAEVEPACAT